MLKGIGDGLGLRQFKWDRLPENLKGGILDV